tara:strand:+ start:321 stop:470 length:150 start_codon:yes stop_codon:yes gene_type:complete
MDRGREGEMRGIMMEKNGDIDIWQGQRVTSFLRLIMSKSAMEYFLAALW